MKRRATPALPAVALSVRCALPPSWYARRLPVRVARHLHLRVRLTSVTCEKLTAAVWCEEIFRRYVRSGRLWLWKRKEEGCTEEDCGSEACSQPFDETRLSTDTGREYRNVTHDLPSPIQLFCEMFAHATQHRFCHIPHSSAPSPWQPRRTVNRTYIWLILQAWVKFMLPCWRDMVTIVGTCIQYGIPANMPGPNVTRSRPVLETPSPRERYME